MKDNHKADISHTNEFDRMYQEMVKQAEDKYKVKSEHLKTEEEMPLDKAGQMTDFEYEGLAYTLPDGYQFKDENGNIINATKIVLEKKKKEYPKTYEECSVINGCDNRIPLKIIGEFTKLINARNAYWRIAGQEMGLGKPWKPDWNIRGYYAIARSYGNVIKTSNYACDLTFVFPTEEMRDAFYENFKEEIEFCKELL